MKIDAAQRPDVATRAPDSAPRRLTRRVTAEAIVLAGGGTAIALQLADPRVAAGVARHSAFDEAPVRRLVHTLAYVTAVVHGTEADARFVARHVERAHERVRGSSTVPDAPGQVSYDANDPDAQRWVAATLYWSARRAHRRAFGRLSAEDDELLLRGFAAIGTRLRMPAASWPATVAEFDEWFDAAVARARVTPAAREAFAKLRAARAAPLWLRLAMPMITVTALAMLPARIRFALEPTWGLRDRFIAELVWAVAVPLYRLTPRAVRTLPATIVLRQVRREAASATS